METVPVSIEDWLSASELPAYYPSKTKRLFASTRDTVARKRRRLSDHPRRSRERSWSDDDTALLSDLPRFPREELHSVAGSSRLSEFLKMDVAGAMAPPPPPSSSNKQRVRTPSQTDSCSARSNVSSRDAGDAIQSSTYRQGVLEPNGVKFRHERLTLPTAVGRQVAKFVRSEDFPCTPMSSTDAQDLSDQLFEIDGEEEKKFLDALEHPGPLPPYKWKDTQYKKAMHCTSGRTFHEEAMPRGPYLAFPKIVRPRPDYAYGYSSRAFSPEQRSVLERSGIYHTAAGLICPFLVVEGKSQACGLNVWQASNQCAGAGSACVAAALTLLGQQPDQAELGLEGSDCVSYSLAVDTALAQLYVHWSDGPGQYSLQCVEQYLIRTPSDLIRLQTHLQNVMEWGMGARLEKVRRSVDEILGSSQDNIKKRPIDTVDT
jgi:hypothetical protein